LAGRIRVTATRPALVGIPAAPGIAVGPWAEIQRPALPEPRRIGASQVTTESDLLREASADAARELREVATRVERQGHADEAAIFEAHALMATDPALIDGATRRIEDEGLDAVGAILASARDVAGQLAAIGDELLSARAADVIDVADRIARLAAGLPTGSTLDYPAVVVAEDLAPSVTASLPRDRLLGICLERSSPTAHAAILARAYGIPAVVGATGLLDAVRAAGQDAEIAIDGSTGEVVIAPDEADQSRFETLAAAMATARARDVADAAVPVITRDGVEVTLLANIGGPDESERAVSLGAAGVGLFRTEFLFLERSSPPTEEEQVGAYRRVIEAFGGGVVTIRLLDVGGDKPIPYLALPREENPFLGVRARRLARERPDLFVTQLRACYRAALAGPVRIMAPMIADASDVATLLSLADRARQELTLAGVEFGPAELGVMLEIPSAVLTAASWLDQVSFASLGTNDLLQYTLAVDRGNPALESYRDSMHPALLRLVRMSAEAAQAHGVSLSVCGEMAGDPVAALALVGLDIRSLSMSAEGLPAVRRAIRAADAVTLATEADAACNDRSAADARTRFAALLDEAPPVSC
jgi:phosphoenolpyruvate-protein phosphotransferase